MNRRLLALLATLALALTAAACGDDDATTEESTIAGDIERYCTLSQELDEAGSEQFEALENDPDATQEDFVAAERDFVESHEDELNEIADAAPEEIDAEVDTVLAGLRGRAGLEEDPPPNDELGAAEQSITDFEKENC